MNSEWIYEKNEDNSCRYALGLKGEKPLICFGVNPSTAEAGILDNTMKSVDRLARNNGYDSWIMLNLYPQRATNPNNMDSKVNKEIYRENMDFIKKIIMDRDCDIWAAWGTLIDKRDYLWDSLRDIVVITELYGGKWVSCGEKTRKGHPRHPLYLKSDTKFEEFDIRSYMDF